MSVNRLLLKLQRIPVLAIGMLGFVNGADIMPAARPADLQQKREPSEVLAAASESGKRVAAALRSYTYYAELTIETVSQADTITGKYYRFSQISYNPDGTRQE